jgi:hypothetical protein
MLIEKKRIWLSNPSGWKSPTRPTLALVFDSGNFSLCCPIDDCVGCSWDLNIVRNLGWSRNCDLSEESLFELFLGEDGKLVDGHLVSLSGVRVVSWDQVKVFVEDDFPVGFFRKFERSAVLSFPQLKLLNLCDCSMNLESQNCRYGNYCCNYERFVHLSRGFLIKIYF